MGSRPVFSDEFPEEGFATCRTEVLVNAFIGQLKLTENHMSDNAT